MGAYRIVVSTSPTLLYLKGVNTTTGEILDVTLSALSSTPTFENATDRNNMITLINGNTTNQTNGFVGQAPPPPAL